jgi:acyl-coenzyme A thioesterase 9
MLFPLRLGNIRTMKPTIVANRHRSWQQRPLFPLAFSPRSGGAASVRLAPRPTLNHRFQGWKQEIRWIASTSHDDPADKPSSSNNRAAESNKNGSDANRFASVFKNPIVHQLWTARQEAKLSNHRLVMKNDNVDSPRSSNGKFPSDSRVEIVYPFSTNELLYETYRNPWQYQLRLGKLMEDLDALAGNIAFFHNDSHDEAKRPPVLVTASVDRIRLKHRPHIRVPVANSSSATSPAFQILDQHLSGQVTWTGTSSMEIRMQIKEMLPSSSSAQVEASSNEECWLEAYVTFVALDPDTKKPTLITPILPQTPQETALFEQGAARAALKKAKRKQKRGGAEDDNIEHMAKELLQESSPLLTLPSLANVDDILMEQTRMQNAMIAQRQVTNLHNQIFGGFLMRRAYELAFATAYMFGGVRPRFIQMDDVSFTSPVSIGDLLVFNARVLYTEEPESSAGSSTATGPVQATAHGAAFPLIHVEVETWVTVPEQVRARLSNQFYFTFSASHDKNLPGEVVENGQPQHKLLRRVLPANVDEARRIAIRMMEDRDQA